MNATVLLVGHGSRQADGNEEIGEFARRFAADHPRWRIETCFIEFAEPLLDDGLDRAARGSERVVVAPLILNAAGHVKMEIPHHIALARDRHPNVEFVYAPHLGLGDPVLAVMRRRLRAAMAELDHPDPKTTGVVVLGRGSSDPGANGELAKLARRLFESGDHELVEIAFTGVTHPRLETVVQRQARLGMTQIVVLPCYLFAGVLITRIRRQMERLARQYPQMAFALGDYFGFEPEIAELLATRIRAAADGGADAALPCDGCRFRTSAEAHGHDHHHHHHSNHDHHAESR